MLIGVFGELGNYMNVMVIKMVTRQNELARKYRKFLIIAFFGKCWFCGSTENLEFFHIKPTKLNGRGRGFWARILDIINNPLSYGLGCHNCHVYFDNELLTLKDVKI